MEQATQKFHVKTWGSEVWFENNEKYCGKLLTVEQGKWSSTGRYHFHKIKDESFFIISGILHLDYVDDGIFKTIYLLEGDSFRVFPLMKHRFTAAGDGECKFIEVSTTHANEDSYRCEWDAEKQEWIIYES